MNTFLRRLASDIPLLSADVLGHWASTEFSALDIQAAEHPVFKDIKKQCETKVQMDEGVAIVPVQGTLMHNPDAYEMVFGAEDSRHVCNMIDGCRTDKDVKGVLLDMDTPGGMMLGGPEIADAVTACRRSGKPVVAHAGGLCASLGYMIASQANHIMANRSAIVGSIGVIASMTDYTGLLSRIGIKIEHFTNKDAKFKAMGAIGTSLSAEQRDLLQSQIESAFGIFKSAVLSARPSVKAEAMQGQTFRGSEALGMGLIDSVGTKSAALAMLKR